MLAGYACVVASANPAVPQTTLTDRFPRLCHVTTRTAIAGPNSIAPCPLFPRDLCEQPVQLTAEFAHPAVHGHDHAGGCDSPN